MSLVSCFLLHVSIVQSELNDVGCCLRIWVDLLNSKSGEEPHWSIGDADEAVKRPPARILPRTDVNLREKETREILKDVEGEHVDYSPEIPGYASGVYRDYRIDEADEPVNWHENYQCLAGQFEAAVHDGSYERGDDELGTYAE